MNAPFRMPPLLSRRLLFAAAALPFLPARAGAAAAAPVWPEVLIAAARAQLGVTTIYDPAYTRIPYPGGDVPRDRGVCTDVIIRAYRDAFGLDLQKLVHEDMVAHFSAYPTRWGLPRPDANIDHRRVPNLMVFLRRKGMELALSQDPATFLPGDLVTQMLPGSLPHIALVTSSQAQSEPVRPLILQNIGAGAREEDALFAFPLTGHFRLPPA